MRVFSEGRVTRGRDELGCLMMTGCTIRVYGKGIPDAHRYRR